MKDSTSIKVTEVIILAGGLGTRIQSVAAGLPKCLLPVAGKPFLFYVIQYLRQQGIQRFVLALGFLHEPVHEFMATNFPGIDYILSVETEALGTGGAVKLASRLCKQQNVLVINADTFFKINITSLADFHFKHDADCSLALKKMENFDRYGIVEINAAGEVIAFKEKKLTAEGLINGGIYILNLQAFLLKNLPERFSFEKDYLEKEHAVQKIIALEQDAYFIDIGIPADLQRAQLELPLN